MSTSRARHRYPLKLVPALNDAALVGDLQGAGFFTVFAPTNAAFSRLSAGTVDSLLLPENREKLRAVLTHHVIDLVLLPR